MPLIKFYFRHGKTRLLTVAGPGDILPELTELMVEVDETQNREGAAAYRNSYMLEDPHGLLIGACHWCIDLGQLGDALGGMWWREAGQPAIAEHFVVKRIVSSSFRFTNLGALGEQPLSTAA